MDFTTIKKRATELKNKAVEAGKGAVEYSAWKLADSKMTLKSIWELDLLQKKSVNTTKKLESGEEKTFVHRSGVIFIDTKSDFFSKMLLSFPVLQTKAYSQNMSMKLMDSWVKDLDVKKYSVTQLPALVIFENEKVYKVIQGEENIQKVVKTASLDINKTIETL